MKIKNFFTEKVIKHQNRLSSKMVKSPSTEKLKMCGCGTRLIFGSW